MKLTVEEKVSLEIQVVDADISYAREEMRNAIKCLKDCLENGSEYQIYQDAPYYAEKIRKAGRQYEMLSDKKKMLTWLLKEEEK